jgi:hypothetical protein
MLKFINGYGPYYYENTRINGRVVTRYGGSGDFAMFHARLDEAERADAEEERGREKAERAEAEAITRQVESYHHDTDQAVRAALEHAGYHRQGRHRWRRKRTRKPAPLHGAGS